MPYIKITNPGMLVQAVVSLVWLIASGAPIWAYGLWIAIGATTVRPGAKF